MSFQANGFLLGTLFVVAAGYIVYDAPICRLWWSRSSGYVLYFRTIVAGLLLFTPFSLFLHWATLQEDFALWEFQPNTEYAPILAVFGAIVLRSGAKAWVWLRKRNPDWEYKLNLHTLNDKELDQFVYQRVINDKMIMVTLESNKVYAGWPVESPGNSDDKWLRLVPEWSGYRDTESRIHIKIKYSGVYEALSIKREHILVSVERIVTVQPFDPEIFLKFQKHRSP